MNISIAITCDSQAPLQETLTNPFNQIVSAASSIYNEATKILVEIEKALADGLTELAAELTALYEDIIGIYEDTLGQITSLLDIIAPFPLSVDSIPYPSITQLNTEWVARGKAIVSEYSTFLIQKMLDLISSLIPVSFLVPVPFFGTIDIVKFSNDAVYRASLKQQLADDIDAVIALIPSSIGDMYSGLNGGIASIEMQIQEIWQWFVQQITTGGYELLYSALEALIEEFKDIWDELGLPAIIDLLTLDIEGLIDAAIAQATLIADGVIAQATSIYDDVNSLFLAGKATELELETAIESLSTAISGKWDLILNYVLDIGVFGITVRDMVTLYDDASTVTVEGILNTVISQAKDWATKYPIKLLLEWMDLVTEFLEAIGLSALLDFIKFTLCDFLELIGFPLSIEINIPTLPEITPI
jgi:hypothetical protein